MNTSISTRFQGVKRAEVAGLFYPEDAGTLSRIVDLALSEARERVSPSPSPPKAIISPHAGYPYSAPVAGSAYAHLESGRNKLQRVIVIGPAHRFGFRGMALCSAEEFETPLGRIPADTSALERVLDLPSVQVLNQAYQREHSLETQFPFLQTLLCDFQVVPIIVGQCDPVFVAQVLDALWGGPETCFVISSDLSHFLTDTDARRMDSQTSNLIETGRGDQLTSRHACGFLPIQGLLQNTTQRGLRMKAIDLRNSSQTVGNPERVVGYGAFISEGSEPSDSDRPAATEHRAPTAPSPDDRLLAAVSTGFAAPWLAVRDAPPPPSPEESVLPLPLSQGEKPLLIRAAAEAISYELQSGQPPRLNLSRFSDALRQKAATFVTLKKNGKLRGCVGALIATEPLIASVVRSAGNAAFRDRRFSPLTSEELPGLDVHISILSAPQPMRIQGESDLLHQLRPKQDGLIIEAQGKSAVFLPSVWEEIPSPQMFLARLKQKAGLDPQTEYPDLQAKRFVSSNIEGRISG